jgi:hypothetical protein
MRIILFSALVSTAVPDAARIRFPDDDMSRK